MPDSEIAESLAATTQQKLSMRLFYTIRARGGFVAANHEREGPPIELVPEPEKATRFIEAITARRRAAALEHLGWSGLSIVPVQIPLNLFPPSCPAPSNTPDTPISSDEQKATTNAKASSSGLI